MLRRQTNIRIDLRVVDKLKARASAEGRSLSEIIREYIARGLRRDETEEKRMALAQRDTP